MWNPRVFLQAVSLTRVSQLTGKQIPFKKCDVCNEKELEDIFKTVSVLPTPSPFYRLILQEKIDAVIHFAALKAVGESVQLPLAYYRNNIVASLNLIAVSEMNNGVRGDGVFRCVRSTK